MGRSRPQEYYSKCVKNNKGGSFVAVKPDYDFAGWVTKNDIQCSDGVTIKQDAFRDNDGQKVPLVWNHDYNSPLNVLGHVILKHEDQGVYGYGYFNDTDQAENAKRQVLHGDITARSIGARKLKRNGPNIIHGSIYEVSLVLAGANPGAMIETFMNHSDNNDGEEKGHIYTDYLIHSSEHILLHDDKEEKELATKELETNDDLTIEEIIDTMNDTQKEAVYALVGMVAGDDDEDDEEIPEEKEVKQSAIEKGDGEQQLVGLAVDLAEQQLRDGTASAAVIQHFLKIGSTREHIEREMMQKQATLLDAKASSIIKEKDDADLAKDAIEAMKSYNSSS